MKSFDEIHREYKSKVVEQSGYAYEKAFNDATEEYLTQLFKQKFGDSA